MSKSFLAIVAAIILIFLGLYSFGGSDKTTSSSSGVLTSHIKGLGKSGVKLIEFADYQCPYCKLYAPIVKQVQEKYNDQIFIQFRNYPLVNSHPNAFAAARAAEASALQDKFWEMHDLLFSPNNWASWTAATDPTVLFREYAKSIGLNLTQYNSDFASSKVNDLINADKAEGDKLGVSGTPSYFLDGVSIPNSKLVDSNNQPSLAAFEKVIDEAIAKKATN